MRPIKFRGKVKKTDEWAYGVPIKTHIGIYIITEDNPHICSEYGYMEVDEFVQVDHDTVGQFTGFLDKSGKEIYEGDIVRVDDWFNSEVFWNEELAAFVVEEQENYLPMMHLLNDFKEYVVIGNIHDNPDLLNGK